MFGFPKVEYRIFKKNFLKTVVFQINFEKPSDEFIDYSDQIKNLFLADFPRFNSSKGKGFSISFTNDKSPDFQETEEGHNIELRSQDGQSIININQNSLTYTLTGKTYSSFSSIKSNLTKISELLSLCSINQLNRVAVRKINIVEFKNEDENPSNILDFMINPNLIGNLNYIPNRESINHCIQSINLRNNDNYLNIKYGLNIPPQLDSNIGQLIIDIDLYKVGSVEVEELFSTFKDINSETFNIFNWVINENTIKILNDE